MTPQQTNPRPQGRWLRWALGCAALWLAATASAQVTIESVSSSLQQGAEVLRIDLSQAPTAVPAGFTIQSPARIALDFPGVSNGTGRNLVDINQGNLRSVNIVQAGDRSRIVLNLRQPTAYRAQIQGKSLLVVLDPVSPAAAQTAPTRFAEASARDVAPIRDIDFRRGQDGAGRVVVDLPNSQVGVDIRQQGQTLVLEFQRASLPESLRRRLDVGDFGTPVQSITTFQSADRVRMVVEPRGNWEHSAYQSDNQFVLEVRARTEDPNRLSQGPGFTGEKLSLNFQNIEIRSLLQVIADFTNFNIITSDSVTGNVTLRLKDVPWDQALDIILQSKGLGMRRSGNVLQIAPRDEIAARERLELEARNQINDLEPLRTQNFQLNYAKAADVARALLGVGVPGVAAAPSTPTAGGAAAAAASARILSRRGSVIPEVRTNQLFVTDIASRLEAVQQLISRIDIPVRQVMIEARIVEADERFGSQLGVRLGATIPQTRLGAGRSAQVGVSNAALPSANTAFSNFVNLPSSGAGGFAPATVALGLFGQAANRLLALELSALESDGRGRIVSSPRVITADQVKALIEQGTELPYQTATASGATAIAFRKANLKLEVTPQITPEGAIILDLDVNKDTVGQLTTAGFAIDTRHISTQVLVENGGTVVIGGIFQQVEREDVTRVPVLGDLPVAGVLFRNRSRTATKSELLVFITPRIVSERAAAR
jgi:type IV pilus assembly protein PilQ